MSDKKWDEMTTDEKLEALRGDIGVAAAHLNRSIENLRDFANVNRENFGVVGGAIDELKSALKMIAEDVAELKKKSAS